MKKFFSISLFLSALLFGSIDSFAQNEGDGIQNADSLTQQLMAYAVSASNFGKSLPQEKVYLHLDNTSYYQGDKIWFQGYVVTADYNRPTGLSKTLYVELLNPGGNLVDRCILPVEGGRASGHFALIKLPFHSGFYEIRAYTKYMLNFGEECIYSRVIPIFDKPQEEGNYADMHMLQISDNGKNYPMKRELQRKEKVVNMKFYPEGGNLVEGITSRVAFEVTNESGEPMELEAELKDKQGKTLAQIKTLHEGRGTFDYTPTDGAKVEVVQGEETHKFNLPKAQEEGVVMRVDNLTSSDSVKITITRSKSLEGKRFASAVMCGGRLTNYDLLDFGEKDELQYMVNKRRLAAGVARIILTDIEGDIVADRLIFTHLGKRAAITITPDKSSYEPFDQVKMTLSIKDPFGNPLQSPVSVAVRDGANDVVSYSSMLCDLLLMSEIKGYIHRPEYYFESTDEEHRKALDHLLMVQGWRRYNWDWWAGTEEFDIKYLPEQGIEVHGQVMRYGTDKPMTEIQLSSLLSIRGTEEESDLDDENKEVKSENKMSASSSTLTSSVSSSRSYGRYGRGSRNFASSYRVGTPIGYTIDTSSSSYDDNDGTMKSKNSKNQAQVGIIDVDSTGHFQFVGNMRGKWHLTLAVTNDKNRRKWSRILLDRNFSPEPKKYNPYDLLINLDSSGAGSEAGGDANGGINITDSLRAQELNLDSLFNDADETDMTKKVHRIKEVEVKAKASQQEDIYKARSTASVYYDVSSEIDVLRDKGELPKDIHVLLSMINDKFVITRASVSTLNASDSTQSHSALDSSNFGNDADSVFNSSSAALTMKRSQWNISYMGKEPLFIVDYEKNWGQVAAYDILNLSALKSIYVSEDKSAILKYCDYTQLSTMEALSRYSCVVFIELYPEDKIPVEPKRGIRKTWVDGYTEPAEFYSPDYSNLPKDVDYRRTLYWNPAAQPDEQGKVEFEFYNNSSCKSMKLSAESLADDGTIGVLQQ